MAKLNSKFQENFYSRFIKFTIISCIAVTILLFLLWFFLIF
ncbi:MAG: aa3-type cytochrome c oxidase subunit IV [Pelagibacteraceae bacterium TMED195]|nr:MAG: aa3-type cytochrome c oxidase subunit IV [Pelagibacteraceae bacterium TMED195]